MPEFADIGNAIGTAANDRNFIVSTACTWLTISASRGCAQGAGPVLTGGERIEPGTLAAQRDFEPPRSTIRHSPLAGQGFV